MTSTTTRAARWTLIALTAALALAPALAGGDWNDTGIVWQPYDAGIKLAKAEKKPVCLVFYTEWCPHCAHYSGVFHDPRVVEKSKSFVMIRLDKDKNAELSARYKPDGDYIPRTYFLSREGELDPTLTAPRDTYRYFYDESLPDGILMGMDAALKRFEAPAKAPDAKAPDAKAPDAKAPDAKAGDAKAPDVKPADAKPQDPKAPPTKTP